MYETMTVGEALAWIARRDEVFAARCRNESLTGVELHLLWDYANLGKIEKSLTPRPSYDALVLPLVMACRLGHVVAKAIRQTSYGPRPESDKLEEICRENWETLWLTDRGDEIVAAPEPKESVPQRSFTDWHRLRFSRADVIRTFPANSVEEQEASRGCSNSPEQSDNPPPAPVPKRAVTTSEVEAAYLSRIAQYEGQPPPSIALDVKEMGERFPHLTRDRVRDLRKKLAPDDWKRKGRRKLAKVKLAKI